MKQKYSLNTISSVPIVLKRPTLIFLKWDLWSWKTTIAKYIINTLLWEKKPVNSPTYTYYNKYNDIYHFDLYRLHTYDEFFAIGWEDILGNNTGIILVEWPEIIEKHYQCDIEIRLSKTHDHDVHEIEIIHMR